MIVFHFYFIFYFLLSYNRFIIFCDPNRDPVRSPVRGPVRGPVQVLSTNNFL